MEPQTELDDKLLRPVLSTSTNTTRFEGPHPDEEALALFSEGALQGEPLSQLLEHLDACEHCRQSAALLISMQAHVGLQDETEQRQSASEAQQVIKLTVASRLWGEVRKRTATWDAHRMMTLAAAAVLLVAVGLLLLPLGGPMLAEGDVYRQAELLLARSDFEEARELLASASKQGVHSDRLLSIEAQAVREIPDPMALAFAGRLTDFGYDVSGAVARDPAAGPLGRGLEEADQLLQEDNSQELELILNRGHLLLSSDQPQEAIAKFRRATQLAPQDALGWLGLGLAHFMLDDLEAAEMDFRRSTQLDPANTAAQINLAMTLQEQGRADEALQVWRNLLVQGELSDADRQEVQRAVELLEAERPN